jgi:hypothetical protein
MEINGIIHAPRICIPKENSYDESDSSFCRINPAISLGDRSLADT